MRNATVEQEKAALASQAEQLALNLEAVMKDKAGQAVHVDTDTPVDKTLNLLQQLMLVCLPTPSFDVQACQSHMLGLSTWRAPGSAGHAASHPGGFTCNCHVYIRNQGHDRQCALGHTAMPSVWLHI